MVTFLNGNSYWNGLLVECSLTANTGGFAGSKVSFPVMSCDTVFSQELAFHKMPYVPGARVEGTGANPLTFKIKAPFIVGLQRGSGETWSDLYPTSFQLLLNILNDAVSPTCTFVHPTLGTYNVKPIGGSTAVDPEVRNGQMMEFELTTSIPDNYDGNNISTVSQSGSMTSSATIFDNTADSPLTSDQITQILQGTPSMTSLAQAVVQVVGGVSLTIQTLTNTINNQVYQVQQVEDSLQELDSAATIGLTMQLERIKNAMFTIANGNSNSSNLSVYIVPVQMTLAAIAANLQTGVSQILTLNPGLQTTLIAEGTQIVYPNP